MSIRHFELIRTYHLDLLHKDTRKPHPLLGHQPRLEVAKSCEEALAAGRELLNNTIRKDPRWTAISELCRVLGPDHDIDKLDVFVVGVAFSVDANEGTLTPEEEADVRRRALEALEEERPHIVATAPEGAQFARTVRNGRGDYAHQEEDRDGEVFKVERRDRIVLGDEVLP